RPAGAPRAAREGRQSAQHPARRSAAPARPLRPQREPRGPCGGGAAKHLPRLATAGRARRGALMAALRFLVLSGIRVRTGACCEPAPSSSLAGPWGRSLAPDSPPLQRQRLLPRVLSTGLPSCCKRRPLLRARPSAPAFASTLRVWSRAAFG